MNGLSGESQGEFSSSMSFLKSPPFSKRFDTSKRVSIVKEKRPISETSSNASSTVPSEIGVDGGYVEQSPYDIDNDCGSEVIHHEDNGLLKGELDCESCNTGEDFQSQSPRYEDEDGNCQTSMTSRGPRTMSVGFQIRHLY